jgi:hypothetical protein
VATLWGNTDDGRLVRCATYTALHAKRRTNLRSNVRGIFTRVPRNDSL